MKHLYLRKGTSWLATVPTFLTKLVRPSNFSRIELIDVISQVWISFGNIYYIACLKPCIYLQCVSTLMHVRTQMV